MRATMASTESDSDRQKLHSDLILILDVDDPSGILDVADALGIVEVQQQELTVEPVVNGDGDRHECSSTLSRVIRLFDVRTVSAQQRRHVVGLLLGLAVPSS
jgi:hypothetical protein